MEFWLLVQFGSFYFSVLFSWDNLDIGIHLFPYVGETFENADRCEMGSLSNINTN